MTAIEKAKTFIADVESIETSVRKNEWKIAELKDVIKIIQKEGLLYRHEYSYGSLQTKFAKLDDSLLNSIIETINKQIGSVRDENQLLKAKLYNYELQN